MTTQTPEPTAKRWAAVVLRAMRVGLLAWVIAFALVALASITGGTTLPSLSSGEAGRQADHQTDPANSLRFHCHGSVPADCYHCHPLCKGVACSAALWSSQAMCATRSSAGHAICPGDLSPACMVLLPPILRRAFLLIQPGFMYSDVAIQTSNKSDLPASGATKQARPFLKWAGGKRQLLHQIRQFYPAKFGSYIEPFVGSGAVFFDLHNQGLLQGRSAVLIDNNADLIGCYSAVRDHAPTVIRSLSRLATAYKKNAHEHYYNVRDKRFNPARQRISNGSGPDARRYTASLAAMLIYLNRTGYNGLFRLNSQGGFNVPIGRYKNPQICDADNLRAVSAALSGDVTIVQDTFESVLTSANRGDFVYFDPPYAPLSRTALFTSYTPRGFSLEDQERLQEVVIELSARGCWVLLSNSTAPDVTRLYDGNPEAVAVGLQAHKVPARRAINSDAAKRGTVLEYLITNIRRRVS